MLTISRSLNLTVASRIHILEPQWNPLLESQAIGRAIRLGQEKQVTVVRYITKDTVEQVRAQLRPKYFIPKCLQPVFQYIRCRQSKKLYLARLGWDADGDESKEEKLKKLTVSPPALQKM